MSTIACGGSFFGKDPLRRGGQARNKKLRLPRSTTQGGSSGIQSKISNMKGPMIQAATCAGLAAGGDLLTQILTYKEVKGESRKLDFLRMLRLAGFAGICSPIYMQWGALLDRMLPVGASTNLIKMGMNAVLFNTVANAAVIGWDYKLSGKSGEACDKVKEDLWPMSQAGAIFWVPATLISTHFVAPAYTASATSFATLAWCAYLSYSLAQPPPNPLEVVYKAVKKA